MEAHLTSGNDFLLEGLSFKPPQNTANYCLTNRSVSYFAESGNKFDPVSSRVIRFRIADQGFLEASSVRLKFTLTNLSTSADLAPNAPCLSMFRRARLFASSQLCEDVTELATQASLTTRLLPADRTLNDSIECHPLTSAYLDTYPTAAANQSRRLISPLPFGVLNQTAWIPTHLLAGGIIIELDLDDADTAFVQSNTDWQITDVALLANVHEIDSSLANTYAQHVLRGSPLHLHYSSVVASRHLVTEASFDINLVRGMTRLRQLYWCFIENGAKKAFTSKGPGNGTFTAMNDNYTWQVTIGSRKWPERACTGVAHTFRSLL